MNLRIRRTTTLLALALACALAAPATGSAATKFDTSYQDAGTLLLPRLAGANGQVAATCEVSGKNLHIAGAFGGNGPVLPSPWPAGQSLALTAVKIRPRQTTTRGVADVRWRAQRIPTNHTVVGSDFDGGGGFAYATLPAKVTASSELKLFRVGPEGRRLKAFGRNGYITIPGAEIVGSKYYAVRVIALENGGVLLLMQSKSTLAVLRFNARGGPDTTWGTAGVVKLPPVTKFDAVPLDVLDAASVTNDGGLLLAAAGTPTAPAPGELGILKLSASGKVVTAWADGGFWTPPAPSDPAKYKASGRSLLSVTVKGGDYAVLYADAVAEELGMTSELKFVRVDRTTGLTFSTISRAGSYYDGGDTGFPDANPWLLGNSGGGPIFAFAEAKFESPGGTFLGRATRFSATTRKPAAAQVLYNRGFATSAFASDPTSRNLYFCGSAGVYSAKARNRKLRGQRKNVAIRRIRL